MREKIVEILKSIIPLVDVENEQKLVDDKIIDSLSLVNVVAELSFEFGVKIGMNELKPENFNSVDAIEETIKRLK